MATLDPSNIVNGNTVETNDLLQLYQAFGTGSGASITGLAMTGSLYGNALTATTATTATTASNITTAITSSGTWYPTFVSGNGTKPAKIASLLEYDATNKTLTVTSSHAVSSSYAANAWDGLYSYQTPTYKVVLDENTPKILFLDTTSTGPYSISSEVGLDGQIVEFALENVGGTPPLSNIDFAQIEITGSTAIFNGLEGNSVAVGVDNTLNNLLPISNATSFKILYKAGPGGGWFTIL